MIIKIEGKASSHGEAAQMIDEIKKANALIIDKAVEAGEVYYSYSRELCAEVEADDIKIIAYDDELLDGERELSASLFTILMDVLSSDEGHDNESIAASLDAIAERIRKAPQP